MNNLILIINILFELFRLATPSSMIQLIGAALSNEDERVPEKSYVHRDSFRLFLSVESAAINSNIRTFSSVLFAEFQSVAFRPAYLPRLFFSSIDYGPNGENAFPRQIYYCHSNSRLPVPRGAPRRKSLSQTSKFLVLNARAYSLSRSGKHENAVWLNEQADAWFFRCFSYAAKRSRVSWRSAFCTIAWILQIVIRESGGRRLFFPRDKTFRFFSQRRWLRKGKNVHQ